MRGAARATAAGLAALALAGAGCAGRLHNLGVPEAAARRVLSAFPIAFVKAGDLYLARGDGSGASRLLAASDVGPRGVIFLPDLASGGRRLLFLSGVALDPVDSTARELALNVLDLEGRRIVGWRRALLAQLLPAAESGRQPILSVAGAAWSPGGRRIALGLKGADPGGGDAAVLFDPQAMPLALHGLAGSRLARAGSLAWMGEEALLLGVDRDDDPAGSLARLELSAEAPRLEPLAPGRDPAVEAGEGRIAAVVEREGIWEIVLMAPGGEDLERIPRPAGRAAGRLWWAPGGRYLYFKSLAATGPLGLLNVEVLRCLDTRTRRVFDLVRLG